MYDVNAVCVVDLPAADGTDEPMVTKIAVAAILAAAIIVVADKEL